MSWRWPSLVTLRRLALLVPTLGLFWSSIFTATTSLWAAGFFVLAGVLDAIHSRMRLARPAEQVASLSAALEALLDRLLEALSLVGLVQLPGPGGPFGWLVAIIVLAVVRELGMLMLKR